MSFSIPGRDQTRKWIISSFQSDFSSFSCSTSPIWEVKDQKSSTDNTDNKNQLCELFFFSMFYPKFLFHFHLKNEWSPIGDPPSYIEGNEGKLKWHAASMGDGPLWWSGSIKARKIKRPEGSSIFVRLYLLNYGAAQFEVHAESLCCCSKLGSRQIERETNERGKCLYSVYTLS